MPLPACRVVHHGIHLVEGGDEFVIGIALVDQLAQAALSLGDFVDDRLEFCNRLREAVI